MHISEEGESLKNQALRQKPGLVRVTQLGKGGRQRKLCSSRAGQLSGSFHHLTSSVERQVM